MRNCILWKNDAVGGGGCFRRRMSNGSGEDRQWGLLLQSLDEQQSESIQSARPSPSLSRLSEHSRSRATEQSEPVQSGLHSQIQSPSCWLHSPCPEQLLGHPSNVQCLPFHPVWHMHEPFLHWPCSRHRKSQSASVHLVPVHPSLHTQSPLEQWPLGPQSRSHLSTRPRQRPQVRLKPRGVRNRSSRSIKMAMWMERKRERERERKLHKVITN